MFQTGKTTLICGEMKKITVWILLVLVNLDGQSQIDSAACEILPSMAQCIAGEYVECLPEKLPSAMNGDQSENAVVGAIFDLARTGPESTSIVKIPQQQQAVWSSQTKGAATPPIQRPPTSMSMTSSQRLTNGPSTNMSMTTSTQRLTNGPPIRPRDWNNLPLPDLPRRSSANAIYDKVTLAESHSDNEYLHTYLELNNECIPVEYINTRLQNVEDMQTILSEQFAEFKADITTEMLSLKNVTANLTIFMQEFSTKLETSLEKIHFQMLENSDHLGKQIMDVRRDFVAASKRHWSVSNSHTSRTYVHSFEWEVPAFDSMAKNQREYTSPFFHISQIDCKISGGLVCTNEERLRILLLGELSQSSKNSNTKFECSVFLADQSGKQPEWLAGKIVGDFTVGREWFVGDVSSREVKKKGFVAPSGNVHLKFFIEMCL